jgi:chromosome segregation ATPase
MGKKLEQEVCDSCDRYKEKIRKLERANREI